MKPNRECKNCKACGFREGDRVHGLCLTCDTHCQVLGAGGIPAMSLDVAAYLSAEFRKDPAYEAEWDAKENARRQFLAKHYIKFYANKLHR